MAFAPSTGGGMGHEIPEPRIAAAIPGELWRAALQMAQRYVQRIQADSRFSARFAPRIQATSVHLAQAQTRIDRSA